MRLQIVWITGVLSIALAFSYPAEAITLDEYGVTLVGNGLVDSESGLHWLDPALTEGTTGNLDKFFSDGWRLATEQELFFLLTRIEIIPPTPPGDHTSSALNFDDYLIMLDALSIPMPGSGSGDSVPWLCRVFGNDKSHCGNSTGTVFVSFFLSADPVLGFPGAPDAMTEVTFITFISEAYLYGTFDTECLDCIGRSLLVRAVPLPAAFWLLLSALGTVTNLRRSSANSIIARMALIAAGTSR